MISRSRKKRVSLHSVITSYSIHYTKLYDFLIWISFIGFDGFVGRITTMKYIDVKWLHESEAYPVRLKSELNDQRFETRKLEFFRDGKVGFASANGATKGTDLGLMVVPDLEEINSDPQFQGSEIGSQYVITSYSIHYTKLYEASNRANITFNSVDFIILIY